MEPKSEPASGRVKVKEPENDKAIKRSPVTSGTAPARRALRERGVGRQRIGVLASPDTNGGTAGSQSQISGRVLRDRSTRTIPAWLQSDQSDDEEEAIPEVSANRRRKVACPRRKKTASSTASPGNAREVEDDSGKAQDDPKKVADDQAPLSQRAQARAKAPAAGSTKGTTKGMCKREPGTNSPSVEVETKVTAKNTTGRRKKEQDDEDGENLLEDEDPPFQDDPEDGTYQPQSQRYAENEDLSSDDDVPFKDDLNDQSYTPRDSPKCRARPAPRLRERKEPEKEPEIKTEGEESVQDVKLEQELGEVAEEPRKRGRRRKDDKTPRLPKRRKKPPVQYVRCEMEGCGTVLAHPRYLQHHIKYQHLLKKKYVCPHPTCGRLFRLQKQLLRHAKHHTDQRDYICEFCARAFKSSHNLAVHRMIHTGEKPLQCEICGFTCRQKASLNWHMKKHDADASYQFSCSICSKKFEKKDSVVAHKAKSHPEVLIAEALAANAGALITTTTSLLEAQGNPAQSEKAGGLKVGQGGQVAQLSQVGPVTQQVREAGLVSQQVEEVGLVSQPVGEAGPVTQQIGEAEPVSQQVGQVSHQVVLLGQDQNLHTMQVPVTIALSAIDPPSPADPQQAHLQFQMPLQFVQAAPAQQSQQQQIQQLTIHPSSVMTQHQAQLQHLPLQSYQQQQLQQGPAQILHMTFQPVNPQLQTHIQQIPIIGSPQQLQTFPTVPQTSASSPPLLPQPIPQDPATTNGESYVLDSTTLSSSSASINTLHPVEAMDGVGKVWQQSTEGEEQSGGVDLASRTDGHVQHALI